MAFTIGLIVVVLLVPVVAIFLKGKYGYAAIALVTVFVATAVFPRSFITLAQSPDGTPYDIAPASLTVVSGVLAFVVGAIIVILGSGRLRFPAALIVFVVALTVGMFVSWEASVPQWSGYFVLVSAALAYAVGWAVGKEVFSRLELARFFLGLLIAILVLQLVVSLLQIAGVALPTGLVNSERTLEQTSGRISGTIGHPANLSKITFVFILLALPFTTAVDKSCRRLAFVAVVLSVLLGGLTVSRANLIATVIILAAWFITYPGRARVGTRAVGAVAIVGASALFGPLVLERFEDDAEGGLRPLLLDAGLRQLQSNLWGGTGPNAYIDVVGQFDAATASGYPVHNAFLLMTAEVGIVLAFFFFLPFFGLVAWSITKFTRASEYLYVPRVIVYAIPGFGIILLTGWGMISSLVIGLWMFSVGFLASARTQGRGTLTDVNRWEPVAESFPVASPEKAYARGDRTAKLRRRP